MRRAYSEQLLRPYRFSSVVGLSLGFRIHKPNTVRIPRLMNPRYKALQNKHGVGEQRGAVRNLGVL